MDKINKTVKMLNKKLQKQKNHIDTLIIKNETLEKAIREKVDSHSTSIEESVKKQIQNSVEAL